MKMLVMKIVRSVSLFVLYSE